MAILELCTPVKWVCICEARRRYFLLILKIYFKHLVQQNWSIYFCLAT